MSFRVGQGFDLHRLVESGRPFCLGGVILEWHKGPVGHSDGDVLLHALIDAMLGACGLGDIGEWFPPGDERFKNIQSTRLLEQVLAETTRKQMQLINMDATLLLEEPKLGSYKPLIRKQLAQCLSIEESCIGIKAKTMEEFGPIGQGDAVAAIVTVLMSCQ